MNLFVCLDEKVDLGMLEPGDILLVLDPSKFMSNANKYRIIPVDYSLMDEDRGLYDNINLFFERLPAEFEYFKNSVFSRGFRPLSSIIQQISHLLNSENITKLVLSDGGDFFLAFNKSEGEGEKFLYKSSWFFNFFIDEYFKDRVFVLWLNKKKYRLKLLSYFRELLLLFIWVVRQSLNSIKSRFHRSSQLSGAVILGHVVSPLQYRHLTSILSVLSHTTIEYFAPASSQLARMRQSNIHIYRDFGFREFLRAYGIYLKLSNNDNLVKLIPINLNGRCFLIPAKLFIRAIRFNFIRYQVARAQMEKYLTHFKNIKVNSIVTAMTYNENIILTKNVCDRLGYEHINFQAVTMNKVLYPQVELATRFFMYSKLSREFYSRYSDSYFFYIPPPQFPLKARAKKDISISIFTQPDRYTDRYIYFLNTFLPRVESSVPECSVTIKLHYRQNRVEDFYHLAKRFDFVRIAEKTDNPSAIIAESDFVISMTSSVLFESIVIGCPGIVVAMDETDARFIFSNDSCGPEVNFVAFSIEDILEIILDKDSIDRYNSKRDRWLFDNNSKNIEEIFSI